MADEEPKIIIDEGWKAQVEKEREQARKAAEEEVDEAQAEASDAEPGDDEEAEGDFAALVNMLATQGLLALGVIAPQDAEEVYVDIASAKLIIDILMTLREKTKGNLEPEEEGLLSSAIADMQRFYVVRAQQAQEHALRSAGVDLRNLKSPGA